MLRALRRQAVARHIAENGNDISFAMTTVGAVGYRPLAVSSAKALTSLSAADLFKVYGMTAVRLEGMRARASGMRPNPYPERSPENCEWGVGFRLMDDQIQQALVNAQSMLSGMDDLRRSKLPGGPARR
jgi:hypothetical protein